MGVTLSGLWTRDPRPLYFISDLVVEKMRDREGLGYTENLAKFGILHSLNFYLVQPSLSWVSSPQLLPPDHVIREPHPRRLP